MSLTEFKSAYKPETGKCINGCGTPPNADDSNFRYFNKSKVLWDLQMDEEEEDESDNNQNITPNIKPYSLQMSAQIAQPSHPSSFLYEKVQSIKHFLVIILMSIIFSKLL